MTSFSEVYVFTKPDFIHFLDELTKDAISPYYKLHRMLELGDIADKYMTTGYKKGSIVEQPTESIA